MKTKHQFNPGDLIRHGERTGVVVDRDGNDVIVDWDDGKRERGKHYRLWMCERIPREEIQ